MPKFKPGQKVVYVGRIESNKLLKYPKKGEIVVINGMAHDHPDHYKVRDYMDTYDGHPQAFTECSFEPIVEKRDYVKHKLSAPCPGELLIIKDLPEVERVNASI